MTNNKDYLSQEEIDALLRQSGDLTGVSGSPSGSPQSDQVDQYLSPLEQDALGEIGNITFGSAATVLSTLLGKKVEITTPKVSVIAKSELAAEFPKPHVAVHVKYVEGFNGINLLVIKTQDAQVIADLMMGGSGQVTTEELNDLHISAVQEAMNQMMGSSATSMSTIFNRFVNISPPGIDILDFTNSEANESSLPPEDVFIKVSFRLMIEDLIDSTIMQLLPVAFAKEMVATLIGGQEPAETKAVTHDSPQSVPEATTPPTSVAGASHPHQQPQQPAANAAPQPESRQIPPAYTGNQTAYGMQGPQGTIHNRNINVQPVQFTDFQERPSGLPVDETNLNLLLDIPLKVTVELGRTHKKIKEILELSQGSIIELDKLAGEPVDILINNKFIAKGEVVVIDENFGVRVTDIVNHWDRIQKIE